jgi:putative membrane protein
MEYMFHEGFLGTRAPMFMDMVMLIVALLPFLVAGAIYFAKIKKYKVHAFLQIFIFVFSVIVLTYFEYGVRLGGGFKDFIENSSVPHNYIFIVLIFHIAISIITLFLWITTLINLKKLLLTNRHKRMGKAIFTGVVFTSMTGIWVYLLLFVY